MHRPASRIIACIAAICLWTTQAFALIDQVQVSNLSDFNLPTWSMGDPGINTSIDICVYTLKLLSANDYAVTASSPGGFVLKNGTQQIPYTLYWEDSGVGNLGSSSGTQLTNGVKLGSRQNGNIISSSCSLLPAGPNARLYLKITQADMTAALAGTYTGTVTLMISPN